MKINITTFLSLAVFASTCFIAGFFIGDWTAYDKKYHETVEDIYSKEMSHAISVSDLMHSLFTLKTINKCESNGCEDAKATYKKLLKKRVKNIEKNTTEPDLLLYYSPYLEDAKELIK